MFPAERDCGDDIIIIFGKHDPDRHLAIIGPIGGVQCAAAIIETDFAGDVTAQSGFEGGVLR
jgi:hypothetical protein